ncbi:hypothetical protein PRK78_002914 [Emydomyces testavorans]|uniref:Atg29 N-terminal domain-containing protein n=1 Tax=Emydomyces testavorans TaxID=2070801 RepID=A0AAF0II10_9EURO|nr:hypothetical protein PRK78_002914 [Emydomyces testavorans]
MPPDPHFTVIVRLPFSRGDFVDPPPQAAWLYGHRLAQVRAEMLKAGHQQPPSPSPTPVSASGSHAPSGYALARGPGGASPIPSKLTTQQREGPSSRPDTSNPPTPVKSQVTRVPSSKPMTPHAPQRSASNDTTHVTMKNDSRMPGSPLASPPADVEGSDELPSSSESDSDSPDRPNLPFRRFGKFSIHRHRNAQDDEEDEGEEEDSPAFLPLENVNQTSPAYTAERDPGVALRPEPEKSHVTRESLQKESTTASTSTTSSGIGSTLSTRNGQRKTHRLGALSPRRAAELARLSPRNQAGRSDGARSMGSSFSDLDDASVTQSALEEALLSNMQNGGVASRMSTLSQALRSRYL